MTAAKAWRGILLRLQKIILCLWDIFLFSEKLFKRFGRNYISVLYHLDDQVNLVWKKSEKGELVGCCCPSSIAITEYHKEKN